MGVEITKPAFLSSVDNVRDSCALQYFILVDADWMQSERKFSSGRTDLLLYLQRGENKSLTC